MIRPLLEPKPRKIESMIKRQPLIILPPLLNQITNSNARLDKQNTLRDGSAAPSQCNVLAWWRCCEFRSRIVELSQLIEGEGEADDLPGVTADVDGGLERRVRFDVCVAFVNRHRFGRGQTIPTRGS